MDTEKKPTLRIISVLKTIDRLDIGRSTLYEWIDEEHKNHNPNLPKPVRQGSCVGFIEHEIDNYILGLMAARGSGGNSEN